MRYFFQMVINGPLKEGRDVFTHNYPTFGEERVTTLISNASFDTWGLTNHSYYEHF